MAGLAKIDGRKYKWAVLAASIICEIIQVVFIAWVLQADYTAFEVIICVVFSIALMFFSLVMIKVLFSGGCKRRRR